MPIKREDEEDAHPLSGRWVAVDDSKSLRIDAQDGALRMDVFEGLSTTTLLTRARPVVREANGSLRAELGDPGQGATYTLSATIRGADGYWREVGLSEPHEADIALGSHGASFYGRC